MASWIRGVMADFVALDERPTALEPGRAYPYVGIRGYGGGLFSGGVVTLGETAYPALNRLSAGMLVLSQVKGWEGAVAVCTPRFEGFLASPEYRTFSCRPGRVLPEFMGWLARAAWFHARLARLTRGQGARRERVRPELFLEMPICLPPVEEQRSLVTQLDRVADLITEAGTLQAEVDNELNNLIVATHLAAAQEPEDMSTFLDLTEDQVPVSADIEYPLVGIRAYGAGMFVSRQFLAAKPLTAHLTVFTPICLS